MGSTVVGPLRAEVLREGARVAFCGLVGGGVAVPVDSAFFWPGMPDCVLLLSFVITLTKLSRASINPSADARKSKN